MMDVLGALAALWLAGQLIGIVAALVALFFMWRSFK